MVDRARQSNCLGVVQVGKGRSDEMMWWMEGRRPDVLIRSLQGVAGRRAGKPRWVPCGSMCIRLEVVASGALQGGTRVTSARSHQREDSPARTPVDRVGSVVGRFLLWSHLGFKISPCEFRGVSRQSCAHIKFSICSSISNKGKKAWYRSA